MSATYKTAGNVRANRNRKAVVTEPSQPLPWLAISWCVLSLLASIATVVWVSRYQAAVADYVREPSEESRSKAHAYDGYPTPTFRQPLIEAADIWFERRKAEHSEVERVREQERLLKARNAKAIAAIVKLMMPAIDHNVDAKRALLTEAINAVEEGEARATWAGDLTALGVPHSLPPGAHLESVAYSSSTLTAKTRCVTADGTFVSELSTVDFQVLDNQGNLWPHFTVTEEDRSFSNASVIVLVDRSGSMEGKRMEQLKAGLLKVLGSVTDKTHMQLVAFDHAVEALTPFTNDAAVLQTAVQSLQPRGATAIAEATTYAISQLQPLTGVKTILLCTDGEDEKLRAGLASIVTRCEASDIQVNVLAIDHPKLDKSTLGELADHTSGILAYAGQPEEIVSQLDFIVSSCKPLYKVHIFPGDRPFDSFSLRLRNAPEQFVHLR